MSSLLKRVELPQSLQLPRRAPHAGGRPGGTIQTRGTARPSGERMLTVYIDADACPVKDEVYKVARRYALKVFVVANSTMRVPADPSVELVVRAGFGAADDWIAGVIGPYDICITSDVP